MIDPTAPMPPPIDAANDASVEVSAPARSDRSVAPADDSSGASWRRVRLMAVLIVIVLLGAALRFTGVDWDEGQHLHPDERFLSMVTSSLSWPDSLRQYLDTANNPLNPYNHDYGIYVYGLSPVVIAKAFGELTGYTGYAGVHLAGRVMSGIMDLLSLVLVFLIGRRLYGPRAGLLGAFLYAFTVLSIQHSHFFTVDMSMTFYVTLALYFAVRVAQGGGWGSLLGLGSAFGLAVSAKISVLTFLLVIGLAFVLRIAATWAQRPRVPDGILGQWTARLGRFDLQLQLSADRRCGPLRAADRVLLGAFAAAVAVGVILAVAFLVFRVAQPQAFTGPGFFGLSLNQRWRQDMVGIQRLVSGETDYPPSHQWAGREPVWYALKNMVLWGLGLPLGIAVWASWALMAYEMYKGRWQHLLPWTWMTLTFFYQSVQFVKTVRYMLPIYPTMAVMAGYGLMRLWELGARWSEGRRWPRILVGGAVGVVILGTVGWALAFTSIYTRPVTRVEASRWIYENIPPGSSISYEVWDDPLPLNLDGRAAGHVYEQVRMDLYWEDTPEKREALYEWLERLDYVVLSSNRLYGSIPRLPTRYPMTTRYYEALFSGELGFEHLITFTSRPSLLGFEIVDDNADETFTVYDHPKVIIFQKGDDFSMARVRELFDGYDLERVVRLRPIQVTAAPNNLMLTEGEWVVQRAGGTWSALFNRGDLANRLPTLTWLLTVTVLGVLAYPIAFTILGRLSDRGYLLSKTLGILLLGYPVWLLASLKVAPYTRLTILAVMGLLAVGSGLLAWRQRREMARFLSARWRLVVANEVLFLVCFLTFWLIRRANPDLWHPVTGGEKPMDLAYLNAIIKSTSFPPYDPWFAGGYLNYYYMGHMLVATLIKLTGIVPEVAYNLAIPALFALTATGAATVVCNLMPQRGDEGRWLPRSQRYGLLGAFFVAVAGNLGEVKLLLEGFHALGGGVAFGSRIPGLEAAARVGEGLLRVVRDGQSLPFRPEWWYWNASRVMPHGEINEFPFFTFLYADLHAHLIALPLTLLALGLAVGLLPGHEQRRAWDGTSAGFWPERRDVASLFRPLGQIGWVQFGHLVLLALAVGVLWAANTWDYPAYLGIALLAVAIAVYHERQRIDFSALLNVGWRGGIVLFLSVLLFLPYHGHYGAAYSTFEAWRGEQTPLGAYLIVHALQLLLVGTYLLVRVREKRTRNSLVRAARVLLSPKGPERARHWYDRLVRCPSILYDLSWYGIAFLGAVLLWLLLTGAWPALFGLPLTALAAVLVLDRGTSARERMVAALAAVGAALTVIVEYVVLKGDIGRMNTVFKFYLQVWVLWGIAGAVGLGYLWPRVAQWRPGVRRVSAVVLAALVVGVSLYPVCATLGKVHDRWDPSLAPGLDGSAYMRTAEYVEAGHVLELRYDLAAIRWLQDNVEGSPVVAEGNAPLYHWASRISTYTGLPTIVGWDWHQRQQRAALSSIVVDWRLQDVRDLYNSEDPALKRELLRRYDVAYVVVGELEAALYAPEGLAAFERMVGEDLTVAYRQGPVTIYHVIGGPTDLGMSLGALRPSWWQDVTDWISRHAFWVPVRAEGLPEQGAPSQPAMLDGPVDELPEVDNRGWNPLARSTAGQIIVWWVVVQVLGLAAWPLVSRVAGSLADAGYGLAKSLGLLVVGYLIWMGASMRVVSNTPAMAWAALALLGAISFHLARGGRLAAAWRRARRLILVEEALFTGGFLAFVAIRLANPDLWQPWFGGEKRMEVAYLNAITKSAYMPPYDPYYSGGTINYYYYGLYLMAMLVQMAGIAPEVGFNLAVPTLYGLTVSQAFALGYHLVGDSGAERAQPTRSRLAAGLGTVALVAVMANLTTPAQIWEGLARLGRADVASGSSVGLGVAIAAVPRGLVRLVSRDGALPGLEYWYGGTRIIPYTINEFPFFSFLFADLHPHMIAIPLGLAILVLLWQCVATSEPGRWRRAGLLALLALALGALGPMNTWDLPTYAMLVVVVLHGRSRAGGWPAALRGLALPVGTAVVGILLYTPFYLSFWADGLGIGLVPADGRSPLPSFLVVWGIHLALAGTYLFAVAGVGRFALRILGILWRRGIRRTAGRLRALFGAAGVMYVMGVGLLLMGIGASVALLAQGEVLLGALSFMVGAACMALARAKDGVALLRALLVLGGLAILLGVEVFYVRDFLDGGEWRRMNTVFKFHLQAWVLLSVALGSALPDLWRWMVCRQSPGRRVWGAALGLLAVCGLAYPFWAVPQRVEQRFPGVPAPAGTLDGTAYMMDGVYHWPDPSDRIVLRHDREALEWLWENVRGTPVLVEAGVGYYREGGLRTVSYTGLPTIVGMHANEQRPADEVARRRRDTDAVYTTTDVRALRDLLGEYRVRYIYLGQLERVVYGEDTEARFDRLTEEGVLRLAYANDGARIYEVGK